MKKIRMNKVEKREREGRVRNLRSRLLIFLHSFNCKKWKGKKYKGQTSRGKEVEGRSRGKEVEEKKEEGKEEKEGNIHLLQQILMIM